jgi:DNA topoisomerase-1
MRPDRNNKLSALKVAARHQRAAELALADLQNLADEFEVELNLPGEGQAFSWDDNDSLADELLDDDTSLCPDMLPAVKIAARYQEKKKVPKANGKGTTEVYVYSEGQVNKRNRDKAERLQKFKPKVEKLRSKVKADLGSKDRETRLVALAVALIDETHERVGNEESAKGNRNDSGEPHYGVTGWTKKHITLGSGSATIQYVGKSGVKHEKTVSTPYVLSALRQAHKEAEGKDGCLFSGDDVSVTAEKVNKFLEPFGISAKDLRGLAANALMQKALKKARSSKLPEDKKKREEQLKSEFKEALERVSDELGHEASTLKSQYLAPNMEPAYLKDGTVIDKLDE